MVGFYKPKKVKGYLLSMHPELKRGRLTQQNWFPGKFYTGPKNCQDRNPKP